MSIRMYFATSSIGYNFCLASYKKCTDLAKPTSNPRHVFVSSLDKILRRDAKELG